MVLVKNIQVVPEAPLQELRRSQGKTVDHVLFSDSAIRAATNAQHWYVTISRGRKSIQIFTPDKDQLRHAIIRSGEHELALDLLSARARRYVPLITNEATRSGIEWRGIILSAQFCEIARDGRENNSWM